MSRDDATRLAFAAGVRYAAESIEHLIDDLTLCEAIDPQCGTCDAYRVAAGAIPKWLAAELEQESRL